MHKSGNRDVSDFEFTLKPITEKRVPAFDRVIAGARALASSCENWQQGKPIGNVRMYSHRPADRKEPRWFARVSEHSGKHGGNAFNQLWSLLSSKDRFTRELKYNRLLASVTMLKEVEWGEVWSLHSTFRSPISPRSFTVLTTSHLEDTRANTPRIGWRVLIPFAIDSNDASLSLFVEPGIVGQCAVVDRIRELENGKVEWLSASTVNFGGLLPTWLNERLVVSRTGDMIRRLDELLEKRARKPSTRSSTEVLTAVNF